MSKTRAAAAILLIAAMGAAWAYSRGRSIDMAAAPEEAPTDPTWLTNTLDQVDTYTSIDYWITDSQEETAAKVEAMTAIIDTNQNVNAFLQAIALAEGTANQADPYRVCYAYRHQIQSFADHPAITGEWKGEKLSDKLCAAAGLGPGCVSTAAGKYQITKGTWSSLKKRLGLKDFAPASQDAAAIELLREAGALGHIEQGRVAEAVAASRKIWASLPGAGYSQPERSLAWLQNQFTNAGGVLA